jgi:hypothetical protein
MATEITAPHEYPSSYTMSIITIMQSGNDPSLFFTKRKLKEKKEQEMIASPSEKQSRNSFVWSIIGPIHVKDFEISSHGYISSSWVSV